jgi:hypothetical protein
MQAGQEAMLPSLGTRSAETAPSEAQTGLQAQNLTGDVWLCATGQKVGDLKPEHFGQLGEVLWAGVAAASLPGLDVPIVDPECVADLLL